MSILLVISIILLMLAFAVFTAHREIKLYNKALKGEVHFLVSKSRLLRRLGVSGLLIAESAFLMMGYFVLRLTQVQSLLFWIPALVLILLVIYLAMRDFRDTRRDIDKIFLEAAQAAIRKAAEQRKRIEN